MNPKNESKGKSVPIQLCLRGTDDLHFVLHTAQLTWCTCLCSECPPWEHRLEECRLYCLVQVQAGAINHPHY